MHLPINPTPITVTEVFTPNEIVQRTGIAPNKAKQEPNAITMRGPRYADKIPIVSKSTSIP